MKPRRDTDECARCGAWRVYHDTAHPEHEASDACMDFEHQSTKPRRGPVWKHAVAFTVRCLLLPLCLPFDVLAWLGEMADVHIRSRFISVSLALYNWECEIPSW